MLAEAAIVTSIRVSRYIRADLNVKGLAGSRLSVINGRKRVSSMQLDAASVL